MWRRTSSRIRCLSLCSSMSATGAETTTALSHREVRFAAQRRSGLRSFPSHRKVRLTAQQAPTASPGLRLEHGLVELCLGKQTLKPRVLLFQLLEPLGLCGLWPTADFVYMPPATVWPWLSSCSALRSLRMICSGLWRLRFMGLLLANSGR